MVQPTKHARMLAVARYARQALCRAIGNGPITMTSTFGRVRPPPDRCRPFETRFVWFNQHALISNKQSHASHASRQLHEIRLSSRTRGLLCSRRAHSGSGNGNGDDGIRTRRNNIRFRYPCARDALRSGVASSSTSNAVMRGNYGSIRVCAGCRTKGTRSERVNCAKREKRVHCCRNCCPLCAERELDALHDFRF